MYTHVKRMLDILLSAMALVVLSPLLLAVPLIIKATSPGPVFFRQKRVGLNKTHFMIYKFRTMRIDAPKDQPTHLLQNPDAFITPVGALAGIMFTEITEGYHVDYGFKQFIKYGVVIALPTIASALFVLSTAL